MRAHILRILIFLHKLQQLHIALHSVLEHHRTFKSKLSFASKMDLNVYIHLIFLCVVNITFTFLGIVLNTLVIVSIWKSSQLRKKLCHFMIMVLSCFDLMTVLTNHPGILVYLISWLREDYYLLPKRKIYLRFTSMFFPLSFLALLVMNIERYLGAYYPIFHLTSVTRLGILTLLAILLIPTTVIYLMFRNGLVFSSETFAMIFMALFLPPFGFVIFKLFTIARKVQRERAVLPGKRTTINLKNSSMGLWAVACLMLLSIPISVTIAFGLAEKSENSLRLSFIWTFTISSMNCTFNSLIFFWKNKVLRAEGIKILKTLKDRLFGS